MGLIADMILTLLLGSKRRSYTHRTRKRHSVLQHAGSASQTKRARIIHDAEARHAGFPSTYAFRRAMSIDAIYSRDRGRCALCGRKVDRRAIGPMSPSIDHRKPLAKGGPHSPKNVQLAHLSCNMKKGVR